MARKRQRGVYVNPRTLPTVKRVLRALGVRFKAEAVPAAKRRNPKRRKKAKARTQKKK